MSDDLTLCNTVHVKNVTWVIAIVQLVFVLYEWLTNGIFTVGGPFNLNFTIGGTSAVAATIWVVFIVLLMYGLYKSKADFVLAHLISSGVMAIIFVVQLILALIHGASLISIISPAVIAVLIVAMLWIEFRCYKHLKHTGFNVLP